MTLISLPYGAFIYRLLRTQLSNIDEGWGAGRRKVVKDWIQKLFDPDLENLKKVDEFF